MWVKPSPALKTLVPFDFKKWHISSSSYSSFVFDGRPKLFWWPLWKRLPRSLDTLPNTRGRALHSSAAGSPHPTSPTNPAPRIRLYGYNRCMVSKDNCRFGKDLLSYWNRDTVTYGCRFWLACVLIVFVQFAIPECKWWEPDSGPWASLNTLYPSWGQSCSQSEWPECPDRSVSPLETTG